jgi:hypothetical protein
VSADSPIGGAQSAPTVLRVQVVFHTTNDRQVQSVAAKMIDSAHEIANLPECECDVDVSVELVQPDGVDDVAEPVGAPARGRAVKH